jgi:rsbT co-antagonist protein RsbR
MSAPLQRDDNDFSQHRFRLILRCGIVVMVLFCIASFITLAQQPALVEALSAAADTAFTIVLIGMYLLLGRLRLQVEALILAGTILIYCILNILLFPDALIRVVGVPLLAVVLALAYINSHELRRLSIVTWLTIALIFWLSNHTLISSTPIVDFVALCAASAIILLVLSQFHSRMKGALAEIQGANTALHHERANLEAQVAERTASLQQALVDLEARAAEQERLLAETEQQRGAIRALSLPILPIDATTLATPLIGAFDSQRLVELQQQVLQAIERSGAKTLVLDITGLPAVDREVALGILRVAQAARLMGARVVLAGIRPEVAQAIVSLGMDLAGLQTTSTFQDGIVLATRAGQPTDDRRLRRLSKR